MKRLLTILLVIISVSVYGQKRPAPSPAPTSLTTFTFSVNADSSLNAYSGSTWLWWQILSKYQADKLYQPLGSPVATPFSLSTGYGLVGSSFDGSVARTWTADTASVGGLVSKSRLATNLTGYVPKTTTLTINGSTRDLSTNRIWNVGTVLSVGATAGTGISIAGTSPITSSGTYTITNTAPDQTVVLNAGTGISTSGTYPNFTITNTLPAVVGIQDSLTKKANRTFDNVASGAIANVKLANSTISGVALGSNLNALTLGNGLTGTSYNGSGSVTATADTAVVQTVSNFFPKGDTRYQRSSVAPTSISATSPIFYNSGTGVISSQAASGTLSGYVTTSTQTFGGNKTFNGSITGTSSVWSDLMQISRGDANSLLVSNASATHAPIISSNTGAGYLHGFFNSSGGISYINNSGLLEKVGGTDAQFLRANGTVLGSTGSGDVVRATSPTLTTPNIGNATFGTLTGGTASTITFANTGAGGIQDAISIRNGGTTAGTGNRINFITGTATQSARINSVLTSSTVADLVFSTMTGGTLGEAGRFLGNKTLQLAAGLTAVGSISSTPQGTLYGTASGSITSAQLATSLTDETGTGSAVFGTSPTLVTPALGNATGGTLSLSGMLTSTQGNNTQIFSSATATTGYQFGRMTNTSGGLLWGIEGSSAGSLLTGGSAYAGVLTTVGTKNLELGTDQTVGLKIDGTNRKVTIPELGGAGDVIVGANNSGDLGEIAIGSGLSLTAGVLTATGGSSGSVTTAGGTAGKIAKFTSASNIENSIMTESSGLIDLAGDLTLSGTVTTSDDIPFVLSSPTTIDFHQSGSGTVRFVNNAFSAVNMSITNAGDVGVRGALAVTGAASASNLSGTNTGDQNLTPYALLASPALTGNPTAPTQTAGDNSTKIATTAYVDGSISSVASSNTYTPTPSAGSNSVTITPRVHMYTIVGKIVTVYGAAVIDYTSDNTTTIFSITLPAGVGGGGFPNIYSATGSGVSMHTSNVERTVLIDAISSTSSVTISSTSPVTVGKQYDVKYSFMYKIN